VFLIRRIYHRRVSFAFPCAIALIHFSPENTGHTLKNNFLRAVDHWSSSSSVFGLHVVALSFIILLACNKSRIVAALDSLKSIPSASQAAGDNL
jgi:hypothetical protein